VICRRVPKPVVSPVEDSEQPKKERHQSGSKPSSAWSFAVIFSDISDEREILYLEVLTNFKILVLCKKKTKVRRQQKYQIKEKGCHS
jgi:hypothetical protein